MYQLLSTFGCSKLNVLLGGIFSEKNQDAMAAFTEAANNFNRLRKQTINLEAVTITVDTTDSYRMQKAGICAYPAYKLDESVKKN